MREGRRNYRCDKNGPPNNARKFISKNVGGMKSGKHLIELYGQINKFASFVEWIMVIARITVKNKQ